MFHNFRFRNIIPFLNTYNYKNIRNNIYHCNKMIPVLEALNKKDIESYFEESKILIKEKFGNEIAENIKSKELAEHLLFLHKWYIEYRVDNTNIKNLILLRTNINHIYRTNKDLHDSIHNLLINILKENKAIIDT